MGWHCDGFMSDDINYIWCDSIPTEYIEGSFNLTQDHVKSIDEMNVIKSKIKLCDINTLYRLDETVIHRCNENIPYAQMRCFVKVSFSKEKYNLIGNSHNYGLDYKWEMVQRGVARNHPSQ